MGRTLYQHIVTLKFCEEEIERTVRATSIKKAILEFKKIMFDSNFWKNTEYTIEAKLKPFDWGNE